MHIIHKQMAKLRLSIAALNSTYVHLHKTNHVLGYLYWAGLNSIIILAIIADLRCLLFKPFMDVHHRQFPNILGVLHQSRLSMKLSSLGRTSFALPSLNYSLPRIAWLTKLKWIFENYPSMWEIWYWCASNLNANLL